MHRTAIIAAGSFVLALTLSLTGCAPSKEVATTGAADASPIVSYPASDYQEQGTGKPGGTLRVSASTDSGSLDLQILADVNSKWIGRILFDNLVYLDEKGAISPWLAKSWTISPDGKIYTFQLREDVTFSDGVKFNAEAVKVNLDRIRDPKTKAAMTTAYIAPYERGEVVDEYTFRAYLSEPYTSFLTVLGQSWLGLLSPKAILETPRDLGVKPVGSGPFVVESYVRQENIRFVKRPDYHWAPDFVGHQGPAYLDRIEVDFVPEPLVRYQSLTAGQHDLTVDFPAQNAGGARANPDLVLHSRINLGNPLRGITFNVERAPFDDVLVRRAVAHAIDREGIERITGFGEYRLKTDFLSGITRFYDPAYRNVLVYDVAKAGRLLDEAGWTGRDADGFRTKNGRRLEATLVVGDVQSERAAINVAIQSDLKRVGFDLQIVPYPRTQFSEKRIAGDYQALGPGFWHTNTPDGLFIVYHGGNLTNGAYTGQNTSRLRDPELDDLLSRARRTVDVETLRELYSQAQRRLTEVVPTVPLYENHTLVGHHRRVRGVVFDTSHNTPFFTTVWLDQGK